MAAQILAICIFIGMFLLIILDWGVFSRVVSGTVPRMKGRLASIGRQFSLLLV